MPFESRSTTPIWLGVMPFLASLQIESLTSAAVALHHEGAVRLYGIAELLMPLPLLCMRPILSGFQNTRLLAGLLGKEELRERGHAQPTVA